MSDAVHRELKAAHPRALAALIDDLRDSPAMRRYPYYHAARAALCAELPRLRTRDRDIAKRFATRGIPQSGPT